MPAIGVDLAGDYQAAGRAAAAGRVVMRTGDEWTVVPLEQGMSSGRTALTVFIPVDVDGVQAVVMAETSLNCWMMASSVLASKFRDEVGQPGYGRLNDAGRAVMIPRLVEAIRRAIPSATEAQAAQAAGMMLDGFGADAPPEVG